MRRRMTRLVCSVLVLLATAAGCGIQDDANPRALAPEDVPFDLLADGAEVVDPDVGEGPTRAVWFVNNEGLLARGERPLEPPVTVDAILTALLAGVSEAEAANGLRTNIAPGTRLLGVEGPTDGLVTVDFSGEILTVSRELQRLALAQVVFTATGLPNVDRILFEFDGEAAQVPGAGDELTSAPLTRPDFVQFDPTAVTTTIVP